MANITVVDFQKKLEERALKLGLAKYGKNKEFSANDDYFCPIYWMFLTWHKLNVENVDKEDRDELAQWLRQALLESVAGQRTTVMMLPAKFSKYKFDPIELLVEAQLAYDEERVSLPVEWGNI